MYSDKTWNNWVLVPLWSAHLLVTFCLVAVLGVDMMEYAGDHDGENNRTLTAFMFFILLALLLSPLEMVLQSYRYLEPWVYLGFQVYKVVISTVFVVILGVLYAQVDKSGIATWITIINIILIAFTVLAAVVSFASLIYGAVVMHRHRKSPWYDSVKDRIDGKEKSSSSR